MTVCLLPTVTFAATSGTCGDNLTWSFDTKTGTLTVSGTGDMTDYRDHNVHPWRPLGDSIKAIVIEEGVTSIGKNAFSMYTFVQSVKLPNTLKSIGQDAFFGGGEFESIAIPASVTKIGSSAFGWCLELKRVEITDLYAWCKINADSTEENGGRIFGEDPIDLYLNGKLVTDLVIPEGITKIPHSIFATFKSIKTVSIPSSVKSIDHFAFTDCTSLTDVKMSEGITEIGTGAFEDCTKLKNINIPESVTTIETAAFYRCESLRRIALPKSITKIDHSTFEYSGLRVIYIPKSVTSIIDSSFTYSEIAHVYYGGNENDKKNIKDLADYCWINNANWVYNASGLPDHVYTDENDKTCNLCEKVTIIDSLRVFRDVKADSWYKQYVDYAYSHKFFVGKGYRQFAPNDKITRAEFVQVLASIEGIDTSDRYVKTKFIDAHYDRWYCPAVKWASDNGIVSGVGNGLFKPYDPITREQMCVMLLNYAKFRGITLEKVEDKAAFADDSKISKWAKAAVYTCQTADIVNGKGKNTFDPQGTGTRAEASVIFTKFHKDYLAE